MEMLQKWISLFGLHAHRKSTTKHHSRNFHVDEIKQQQDEALGEST